MMDSQKFIQEIIPKADVNLSDWSKSFKNAKKLFKNI